MISVDSLVDLRAARRILGQGTALAGNLHPVFVLEEKSEEEIYGLAMECLSQAAGQGGFMLLPGCDLSARAEESKIMAFTQAARDFRRDSQGRQGSQSRQGLGGREKEGVCPA
jgi:uroporphyrinogen decarboxylase